MLMRHILKVAASITMVYAVCATAVRADTLDDIIKRGSIRVAIDISAPPFGFQNEEGQSDGSDVATAQLLANALGVNLEVVPVTSANRIAYLQSGRTDLTMSSLAISPERAKAIAFSSPYGFIRSVIFASGDVDIKSYEDLVGKKVGVARGTTNETDLVALAPEGTDIVRFDDEASVIGALAAGQIDAYAVGEPLGSSLIRRYPDRNFTTKLVMRVNYYAVGLPRNEAGLLQWVNTFVMYYGANGELARIYKKYVGVDLPTLPPL